ncbi:MAG: superoxide dismutase [Methylophilaceae bacterium 17-44-8]|jgi:Cu-Zn family superoxide dismutase|nr:MAG: superoxide dismutase [Methylophilales bacterium 28-44-11]OZA06122.1 MAG: superoxide dismutase [Methylophilaceae bacterium 17-44-8]
MKLKFRLMPLFIMLCAGIAMADTLVQLYVVDANGIGPSIGQVSISESKYGMVFTPSLRGLPPGMHGFHLHQKPSCDTKEKEGKMVPALAAGGHYDPLDTNRHDTPWGNGHLGDLPAIFVDAENKASQPVLAPRLKAKHIAGRSLMIHVGGDNHADHPAPLGGGGERMACGVIDK